MTKWTVIDIPRSDFKVARQRGARAGRRAHTALVNATQFRSAAFKPWRHPTTQRRFALFLDVGENFAAKELGAFWCHDEKQWMYETSRTDADIPRWIHRRRVPFPRVKLCIPFHMASIREEAKAVGCVWDSATRTWTISQRRAAMLTARLRAFVIKEE